jgi:hypothetical protein
VRGTIFLTGKTFSALKVVRQYPLVLQVKVDCRESVAGGSEEGKAMRNSGIGRSKMRQKCIMALF